MPNLYDEFVWRGMLYDATEGLKDLLAAERVTAYIGFDPTASSLHVGSLLPVMALARLQRFGHSPIAIVGGGTGMIGDPSGKSQERALLSGGQIDENLAGIRKQLARFLDFETAPNPARIVNNADWLGAAHAGGALRDQNDGSGGLVRTAVTHNRSEILDLLLDFGFDPDERVRLHEGDDAPFTWGMALQHAVHLKRYGMAETLLERGADPNASIYASGDPVFSAYSEGDQEMIALLERYGGVPAATTAGLFRQTELARRMLAGEAPCRIDGAAGESLGEQLLWGGACGGDPEIVRMALEHVDWPPDDPRWFTMLEQPLRTWTHGAVGESWDKSTYLTCFRLLLERCDPNLRGRPTDGGQFGLTTLHHIVARGDMTPEERVAFATAILDCGARLDMRDHLLKSTPLGWACRWGQLPLVKLFLDRGADPLEPDAEPWATPRAWAERMNRGDVLAELRRRDT